MNIILTVSLLVCSSFAAPAENHKAHDFGRNPNEYASMPYRSEAYSGGQPPSQEYQWDNLFADPTPYRHQPWYREASPPRGSISQEKVMTGMEDTFQDAAPDTFDLTDWPCELQEPFDAHYSDWPNQNELPPFASSSVDDYQNVPQTYMNGETSASGSNQDTSSSSKSKNKKKSIAISIRERLPKISLRNRISPYWRLLEHKGDTSRLVTRICSLTDKVPPEAIDMCKSQLTEDIDAALMSNDPTRQAWALHRLDFADADNLLSESEKKLLEDHYIKNHKGQKYHNSYKVVRLGLRGATEEEKAMIQTWPKTQKLYKEIAEVLKRRFRDDQAAYISVRRAQLKSHN